MSFRYIFSALVALLVVPIMAEARALDHCGPMGPVPGMTVGAISTNHQKPVIRSAAAIAAVVQPPSTKPVAWIIWDQNAQPWIMVKNDTPRSAGKIAGGRIPVQAGRFVSGTYGVVQLNHAITMPADYELLACPFIGH